MQDQATLMPAASELLNDTIRILKPHLGDKGSNGLLDELPEGDLAPAQGSHRVCGCRWLPSGETERMPSLKKISATFQKGLSLPQRRNEDVQLPFQYATPRFSS